MPERIKIPVIREDTGETGNLEVSRLWRGNGDKQTDVVVHFFPEGTTTRDFGKGKKGIVSISHINFPATVETVAKSIIMSLKSKKHIGD